MKGEWGVPIALQQPPLGQVRQWPRERGKSHNTLSEMSLGLGAGAEKGAGEAREQGNGLSMSQRGLPEREREGTEIRRGGSRAGIKRMRVWQSEECSSKTPLPPGPAQGSFWQIGGRKTFAMKR